MVLIWDHPIIRLDQIIAVSCDNQGITELYCTPLQNGDVSSHVRTWSCPLCGGAMRSKSSCTGSSGTMQLQLAPALDSVCSPRCKAVVRDTVWENKKGARLPCLWVPRFRCPDSIKRKRTGPPRTKISSIRLLAKLFERNPVAGRGECSISGSMIARRQDAAELLCSAVCAYAKRGTCGDAGGRQYHPVL